MAVTRTIPDVRSTNVDKTIRFYTEFLGFDVRRKDDQVAGFVSATNPEVELTLNHGAFVLPPGFLVEVESGDQVGAAFEQAKRAGVRIVTELRPDTAEFSALDPNGHCVTVASPEARPLPTARPASAATITNALAGVTTNDLETTRDFYVNLLGFVVGWERDGLIQLRSLVSGKAELIVASSSGGDTGAGKGFDVNVGSIERVERLHRAAVGSWIVVYEPETAEHIGIRGFSVLDPSSTPVHVYAPLHPQPESG